MQKFRWYFLLGRRFFKIVPGNMALSVFLILFSKLTAVLSSYLPLKVVLLLGSSDIPKFFPASYQRFDHDTLVIGLCAAAVLIYLLYLAAEKLLLIVTNRAADTIIAKAMKIPMFDNQQEFLQLGFQRFSQSLSDMLFLSITIAALGWIYPDVLLLMLVYGVLVAIILRTYLLTMANPLEKNNLKFKTMLSNLLEVGFLLAFVFMIYQAISGGDKSILIMILSFLLIRRSQASTKQLINNLNALANTNVKLNALLFRKQVLVEDTKSHVDLFWSLTEPAKVTQWVGKVIERATGVKQIAVDCLWFQLDTPHILCYRVSTRSIDGGNGEYLIKLCGKQQTLAAMRESEILMQFPELPGLKVITVDKVEGLSCILLKWENGKPLPATEFHESEYLFYQSLIKFEPPEALLSKYLRSHPILPKRLDANFWEKVQAIGNFTSPRDKVLLRKLLDFSEEINKRLESLPLVIINPVSSYRTMYETENKTLLALCWDRWSIEPMGAGCPPLASDGLSRLTDSSDTFWNYETNVSRSDLRLAALMYSFEELVNRQKFYQAFTNIPDILDTLEGKQTSSLAGLNLEQDQSSDYP